MAIKTFLTVFCIFIVQASAGVSGSKEYKYLQNRVPAKESKDRGHLFEKYIFIEYF